MVLHNSKWDRKAKRQYQRKHGIVPVKKDDGEVDSGLDNSLDNDVGSGLGSDVDNGADGEQRLRKVGGNAWRFQEWDAAGMVDSEAGDEQVSEDELAPRVDYKTATPFTNLPKAPKKLDRMTGDELMALSLDSSDEETPRKGTAARMTAAEVAAVKEQRLKADQLKQLARIKERFSSDPRYRHSGKVLQIDNLSLSDEQARAAVESSLRSTNTGTAGDLDSDLQELMGLPVVLERVQPHSGLDDLISRSRHEGAGASPAAQPSAPTGAPLPASAMRAGADAFLDELLG